MRITIDDLLCAAQINPNAIERLAKFLGISVEGKSIYDLINQISYIIE